jgi:hypothetical protein
MQRLLALIEARGAGVNPYAFVFASRNGTGLARKVTRRALDRAVEAANLAAPKPTLHDLRHSHASMLIALDYNLVAIQRRLGHRKPDTTLKLYAHEWKVREAQRSQIGAQLGQLFADGNGSASRLPEPVQRRALPSPANRSKGLDPFDPGRQPEHENAEAR